MHYHERVHCRPDGRLGARDAAQARRWVETRARPRLLLLGRLLRGELGTSVLGGYEQNRRYLADGGLAIPRADVAMTDERAKRIRDRRRIVARRLAHLTHRAKLVLGEGRHVHSKSRRHDARGDECAPGRGRRSTRPPDRRTSGTEHRKIETCRRSAEGGGKKEVVSHTKVIAIGSTRLDSTRLPLRAFLLFTSSRPRPRLPPRPP